jgi:serine/threonine protein kinase
MLAVDDCRDEVLTCLGTTPGTPEYMALEQATGHWVDTRSDLYSVGVLLYELVSGHVPFAAEDAVRVLGMHVQAPVPPLPPAVPEAVARLVFDLLEKDPERRIQSASECAARIESLRTQLFTAESPAPQEPEPKDDDAEFVLPVQKSRAGWIAAVCALTLVTGAVSMLIGQQSSEVPTLLGASVRDTAGQVKAVRLTARGTPSTDPEPPVKAQTRKKSARSKAPAVKRVPPAKTRAKAPPRERDARRQAAHARRTGPFGIYVPPPNQWF